MIKATVQAAEFVGTGLALWGRGNGGHCGGAFFAAGGHLAMVHLGVGSGAERAEGSLEWADLGIRVMTESPALSALDKANVFFGRGNDKVMLAIHEGLTDEVLHGETAAGVMDVEPHRP